ncbi:MAG: hypothetical protein V1755_05600 [Chloroflexota bacterium]
MDYQPTHQINLDDGTMISVLLVDGAAYTQEEWESETSADYECDECGVWTFQGQPFAGTVEKL